MSFPDVCCLDHEKQSGSHPARRRTAKPPEPRAAAISSRRQDLSRSGLLTVCLIRIIDFMSFIVCVKVQKGAR